MSQHKRLIANMPKLLRHDAIDKLMFGYVIGIRDVLPSVTIKKALELFTEEFDLSEDDYPLYDAQCRFTLLMKEYTEWKEEDI